MTINTERTTAGLRDGLFGMFDDLRSGKITPQDAVAASKIATQIGSLIKIDMEYARFISDQRTLSDKQEDHKAIEVPTVQLGLVGGR